MKNNDQLEKLYQEAEQADFDVFAEQRSNILLVSGDHYTRAKRKYYVNRIRDSRSVTDDQKLRLTKNHMNRIVHKYINAITTNAPGLTVVPDNEGEIQDQKTAQLNKSVWEDIKHRQKFKKKIREYAFDFVSIGEVAVKVFWNPYKGKIKGYEEMEMPEEPVVEEGYLDMGKEKAEKKEMPKPKPIFEGDFEIERIFGFNLLRAPEAKSWDESPYNIIRKMVSLSHMKKLYEDQPDKLKLFQADGKEETYIIFEGKNGSYSQSKDQVLIQEFYYKPCLEYPQGYYYIKTRQGILEEGELPFGLFPIIFKDFQEFQTSPRGRSIIKQLRPYQIEINRTASAIATHQITVGDDKLVVNSAGKVEMGSTLPGVRVIKTNGFGTPTVIPGRTGEQYLPYLESQISEMYQVAEIEEFDMNKQESAEPMVMLMRSVKQKKVFSIYIEKFEEFLEEIGMLCLTLAKHYYDDDRLVPAIGKREIVNIPEFRSAEDVGYRFKVVAQSEDIESNMGKQLVMNHVLQYASAQLEPEHLGKLIRSMPFANAEEAFSDLTIDYDNAKNMLLALDRGEAPLMNQYDSHTYMIKKLTHRMRQADFNYLSEEIKANYDAALKQYEQMEADQAAEIQRAQSGFIPSGGYTVKADLYITDEDGKTKRAAVPYQAMEWLIQKLDEQGMSQQAIATMQQGNQAEIASMMGEGQANPNQQDPSQGQQ